MAFGGSWRHGLRLAYAAAHARPAMAHPAHLQRGREPRGDRHARRARCSRAAAPEGFRILVVDDDSPDGTGAIADALAAAHRARSRCCTGRARRPRAAPYLAGFDAAPGRRRGLRDARWTPTSRTTRPTSRACSRRRAAGAGLALGSRYVAGRRDRRLGPRAPGRQPRRIVVRAPRARRGRPRPHRRLQVLPRRGARRPRPRDRALARLRLPGRADLPRALAEVRGRRGPDRLPRPRARASRRCRGGSRSRPRGWCPRCATARGAPSASAAIGCKVEPPRAEAMSDEPTASRLCPGHRSHPRHAPPLEGRPRAGSSACWVLGALAIAAALLLRRLWRSRHRVTPDPAPMLVAAGTPPAARRRWPGPRPQLARARAARLRLRRGLHRRQRAARRGRALSAASAPRPPAAGPLAIAFVGARDAVLARHAGLSSSGSGAAHAVRQLGVGQATLHPHAAPPRPARADRCSSCRSPPGSSPAAAGGSTSCSPRRS